MRVRFFYLPLLLLFASPVLMAQKDTAACNLEIGIRHNGHIDFWTKLKIGIPGGPLAFPGSDWYKWRKDIESYYYEGIGIAKRHGCLTYRLWVDYFNLRTETNMLDRDTIFSGGYQEFNSGIRLSPGVEKQWHWKFMSFNIGGEVPVYFQTKRKTTMKTLDYNISDDILIWTDTYKNGLKSVGVTAFAGVDFHFLKRMSAGMEFSNGILFVKVTEDVEQKIEHYDANNELYKTNIRQIGYGFYGGDKTRWFYLIPSLSLSYRL